MDILKNNAPEIRTFEYIVDCIMFCLMYHKIHALNFIMFSGLFCYPHENENYSLFSKYIWTNLRKKIISQIKKYFLYQIADALVINLIII